MLRVLVVAVLSLVVAGCGETEAADPADPAVKTCAEGQVRCGDACVPESAEACGEACEVCAAPERATALCMAAACDFVCDSGFSRCASVCADLDTDPDRCGSCDNVCPAGTLCAAGECVSSFDCRRGDRCREGHYCDTGSGQCEVGCADDASCPQPGTCDLDTRECRCDPGHNLCDDACVPEGPTSCGAACRTCSAPEHAAPVCERGACDFACDEGWDRCGGACLPDDVLTCDTSCIPCTAPENAAPACAGRACDFACNGGFYRCGDACVSDDVPFCGQSGGALLWALQTRGAGGSGHAVAPLPDGSLVVAGTFQLTATFGPGEPGETTLRSQGSWDAFVARWTANGSLAWARSAGGAAYVGANGVAALPDGSVVAGGQFSGTAVFGAGEAAATTLTSAGGTDLFVARYGTDGTLLWARSVGGPGPDKVEGVVGLPDGSVVVTGNFSQTTVFGAGEENETTLVADGTQWWDVFVARYAADGTLAWARRAGGGPELDEGLGLAAMSDGSVVVTGRIRATAVFAAGEPNETTLVTEGNNDVFLARYGTDGALLWVRSSGGAGSDIGQGVAVLPDDSIALTGSFTGTVAFGSGEELETSLTSAGDTDVFLARYGADGALRWARRAGGGTGADLSHAVVPLADGSVVVAGEFKATAVFGPGDENETTRVSAGSADIFTARFGPDGSFRWVRAVGNARVSSAKGVATLTDGSVVITGDFRDTVVFGEGEQNQTTLAAPTESDLFVARYAP